MQFLEKKPCNKREKRPLRKLNLQESDFCLHLHLPLVETGKQSLMNGDRQNCQIWASINQRKKCIPGLGILFWKCLASSLHKSIPKKVKHHNKLCLASAIFHVYYIPYVNVISFHVGRKTCLSCSEQWWLTKTSVKAGDSSWLTVDLYAPAIHRTAKICVWPWKQTGIKANIFAGLFVFTVSHTKI